MLNKFEKQWDIKNDMNNKLRVMKEWYSIKSYVPEEYDAYISYADKRQIIGALGGKKVTKIKSHPDENQILDDAASDSASQQSLVSLDVVDSVPINGFTDQEMIDKKKQQQEDDVRGFDNYKEMD